MLDLPQLGGPTNTTFMSGRVSPMLENILQEFTRFGLVAALHILVLITQWKLSYHSVVGYSCCQVTINVRD